MMLTYTNISEEDLKRVDGIIWGHFGSSNWCFSNQTTWAGVVVVHAKPGESINRDAFNRGKVFENLKTFSFEKYARVAAPQVESALRQFVQDPDVIAVTHDED